MMLLIFPCALKQAMDEPCFRMKGVFQIGESERKYQCERDDSTE